MQMYVTLFEGIYIMNNFNFFHTSYTSRIE
jgi:hypothetical protein